MASFWLTGLSSASRMRIGWRVPSSPSMAGRSVARVGAAGSWPTSTVTRAAWRGEGVSGFVREGGGGGGGRAGVVSIMVGGGDVEGGVADPSPRRDPSERLARERRLAGRHPPASDLGHDDLPVRGVVVDDDGAPPPQPRQGAAARLRQGAVRSLTR